MVATPFIFTSGDVVSLASLVSSANTKATAGWLAHLFTGDATLAFPMEMGRDCVVQYST